jgi:hypothetical protein
MKTQAGQWSEQSMADWEKRRAKGMAHFVWVQGVLQWSGFMFCFTLGFFQVQHYGNLFSTEGNLSFRITVGLMIWCFVGLLYGRSRWQRNEQIYLEQKAAQGKILDS